MINLLRKYKTKKLFQQYGVDFHAKNKLRKKSLLTMEEGSSISSVTMAFNRLEIGARSYVRSGSEFLNISAIGRFCSISNGVVMGHASAGHPLDWVSSHPFQFVDAPLKYAVASTPTRIEHDVWIGRGAIIMEGVHIGTGAVVSAWSLVTRDVPPYTIVAGMPARVIKRRHAPEVVEGLIHSAWWELPVEFLLQLPLDQPEAFLASLQNISKPELASYKRVEITRNNSRAI